MASYKGMTTTYKMENTSTGYTKWAYAGYQVGVNLATATGTDFFQNDPRNTFAVNDVMEANLSDGVVELIFTTPTTAVLIT